MTEPNQAAPTHPPPARWAKRVAAAVAIAALGAAAYYAVLIIQRSIVFARRDLVMAAFQNLGPALDQYRNDAGNFMPWRMTDSGPELNLDFWGASSAQVIEKYLPFDISDPFAPPPRLLRYWANQEGWTTWSIGPDRRYDIVDPKDYEFPGPKTADHLAPFQYDPTNGLLSAGDLFLLYRAMPGE